MQKNILIQPDTLWQKIKQTTENALGCGALQPIPTEYDFIEQDGINFIVRILANLQRKETAKKQQKKLERKGKDFNPFLPYEKELFVTDISDTHLCLLNKYNVVDNHLLIITREFEHQETWLTLADFTAMWAVLAQFDGLVFYNAGTVAGASQKHKHLQIVPLPLSNDGFELPIAQAIAATIFNDDHIGVSPIFPFAHAIAFFHSFDNLSPLETAQITLKTYHDLLTTLGLEVQGNIQTGAYNLLATKQWMMIIPRSQECYNNISVNSLGFAGALLVKNTEQMQLIQQYKPLNLLKSVAMPK